jgi:hypothetical protein
MAEDPKTEMGKTLEQGFKDHTVTCTKTKRHIVLYIRREVVNRISEEGWSQVGKAARQAEKDLPETEG